MRKSIASLAFISRRRAEEAEYLAQWNADWSAFHFIGGHKQAEESFRECLLREISEELGPPADGFAVAADPTAHLHFTAFSRRVRAETGYTIELFDVDLGGGPVLEDLERRPENAWLTTAEIAAGVARDGRAISATMALILWKTARLSGLHPSEVFAIGVTGHRDLCSLSRDTIERRLHAIFDRSEREAGGRTIEALSPLAAGADRLFAQTALERGYRLIAPLPLPLDLYRDDFRSERGIEFERLRLRAAEWYSLPLGGPSLADEANEQRDGLARPSSNICALDRELVAAAGPARNAMYEAVGRHIVERSDLLVALWDGQLNGKRGGTGEIVAYARRAAAAGQALHVEVVPVRREKG